MQNSNKEIVKDFFGFDGEIFTEFDNDCAKIKFVSKNHDRLKIMIDKDGNFEVKRTDSMK